LSSIGFLPEELIPCLRQSLHFSRWLYRWRCFRVYAILWFLWGSRINEGWVRI